MTTGTDHNLDDLRRRMSEGVAVMRRRWRIALTVAGFIGATAFWSSNYVQRVYTASTLFERRDDAVLRNLIHSNSPYSFDQLRSNIVLDMTGSRALANAAITVGLASPADFASQGALTEEEASTLTRVLGPHGLETHVQLLSSSPSLDTISVECSATDPNLARNFAIAIRDNYIGATRDRIADVLQRSQSFFKSELERHQEHAHHTAELISQRWSEMPGLDLTNPTAISARLDQLRSDRDQLTQRAASLEAEISARHAFLAQIAEAAGREAGAEVTANQPLRAASSTDPTLAAAIRTTEMEIQDAQARHRMTEAHPTVRGLQLKLDALRELEVAAIAQAVPTAEPGLRPDDVWLGQQMRVQMELDALNAQLANVLADRNRAVQSFDEFELIANDFAQQTGDVRELQSQLEQHTATVRVWRDHLAQLERVMAAQQEQRGTLFTLVEEPRRYALPTSPNAASVVALCSGCGFAAALLIIALLELLDRSLRTSSQVTQSIGIPIIECIATIDTPRERARRARSRAVWTPVLFTAALALSVAGGLAYLSLTNPTLHERAMKKLTALSPIQLTVTPQAEVGGS